MKNYLVSFLCLAAASQLNAEKVMGAATYIHKTFTVPLTIMGPLTGTNLTASAITVNGPAKLTENSTIGTADIRGPLNAQNSTFTGKITVHGNIKAVQSTFKDSLMIYGSQDTEITLKDTDTEDITIQTEQATTLLPNDEKKKSSWPQVRIQGTSHVKGDITFIGEEGSVIIEKTAQHSGMVSGARKESPATKKHEPSEGAAQ